jgi:AcrR family transcriptional regulator
MADVSRRSRPARIAILKAARRLFEDKEFISVTLEEVARAAGVSRQAVYTNFGSRAGLLVALVAYVDEVGGLQPKIGDVLGNPTAVGALEALVDFRARYTRSIYRLAIHVDAARRSDADAEASWQDRMKLRYAHSRAIAHRLGAEGVLAAGWTEGAAADLIWSMTSIRTYEELVIDRGWSLNRYRHRVKAILVGTLVDQETNGKGRSSGSFRRFMHPSPAKH